MSRGHSGNWGTWWGHRCPRKGGRAEVALPRSHLVEAARSELVEAHEWVGLQRGLVRVRLQRGLVRVPGRVRSSPVPFFHEEVLALKLKLGVGAARGRLRVVIGEQMLGGNWEGSEPVRAQYKQHGVREGVKGEVGPVFQGRSCLEPREGEAASRVPHAQDPVVWRVAVKRRGLHGGRESCGRWVDLRGGAQDSKVCQATLVHDEEPERWEAGLYGQDVRGGRHEAIGCPSLDLVPEHGELPNHVDCGHEDVRAIAEDGEEEGGCQSMAEEGREADPWGGESLNRHKGRLGFGQPLDEVGGSGDRGGEPVA